jgi:hypothetical protein
VDIARLLAKEGHSVFHYDYYGTGDSGGESYEMDMEGAIDDLHFVISYVKDFVQPVKIVLFGTRLGGDIAMKIAAFDDSLDNLILVEPLANGRYYYRSRFFLMKSAHFLYDVKSDFNITINGMNYENFDGIPVSQKLKNQILEIKPEIYAFSNKNILLYNIKEKEGRDLKLDILSERSSVPKLKSLLETSNRIRFGNIFLEDENQSLASQIWHDIGQFAKIIKKTYRPENNPR